MAGHILKWLNKIISLCAALGILLMGSYCVYALWDNHQILAAAGDVQADMLKLKPAVDSEDEGASFEDLLAINKDVCGWITLDHTAIDHPILQGENILSYINTDVYGNVALAGSIFLDPDNDKAFTDNYALIYGHHMDDHKMFGDLDLYKDETFFDENTTGTLILPDRTYKLEIFALLLVPASEESIFNPEQWFDDIEGLLSFAKENAKLLHESTWEDLRQDEHPQILGLSTCSTDFTDARTVLLTRMISAGKSTAADTASETETPAA